VRSQKSSKKQPKLSEHTSPTRGVAARLWKQKLCSLTEAGAFLISAHRSETQTNLPVSKQTEKACKECFQKREDEITRKREPARLLGQLEKRGTTICPWCTSAGIIISVLQGFCTPGSPAKAQHPSQAGQLPCRTGLQRRWHNSDKEARSPWRSKIVPSKVFRYQTRVC